MSLSTAPDYVGYYEQPGGTNSLFLMYVLGKMSEEDRHVKFWGHVVDDKGVAVFIGTLPEDENSISFEKLYQDSSIPDADMYHLAYRGNKNAEGGFSGRFDVPGRPGLEGKWDMMNYLPFKSGITPSIIREPALKLAENLMKKYDREKLPGNHDEINQMLEDAEHLRKMEIVINVHFHLPR